MQRQSLVQQQVLEPSVRRRSLRIRNRCRKLVRHSHNQHRIRCHIRMSFSCQDCRKACSAVRRTFSCCNRKSRNRNRNRCHIRKERILRSHRPELLRSRKLVRGTSFSCIC